MLKGSYKNLQVWVKAIDLADLVYNLTKKFPKNEEYGLKSQLRRAAVSVPSNIAEGSQRTTDIDFGRFIAIAKGSLAEVETQIIIANKQGLLHEQEVKDVIIKIDELQKMLYVFLRKLTAKS